MTENKVYIVGISPEGPDNLSRKAKLVIRKADHIYGGQRLLDMFDKLQGEKIAFRNNLTKLTGQIKKSLGSKKIVVLASGDPDLYGIAGYLREKIGRGSVETIANVSAIQIAFSRIKETWEDAVMLSVHSRPINRIVNRVRSSSKIAILTDNNNTPAKIAKTLLEAGMENCRAYVCQDLGTKQESILRTDLKRLQNLDCSPLNILILLRKNVEDSENIQLFGIPDDDFHQKTGSSLITKHEIRAVSLAKLGLTKSSVIWDIGAGSGAVSIEASLIVQRGIVFAIEEDKRCLSVIWKNVKKFGRNNVKIVESSAPEGLDDLPDPEAIFIGGSRGRLSVILDYACRRLKPGGKIVCNLATVENIHNAITCLQSHSYTTEITTVNISRSRKIAGLTRLEPLNPVFIITGSRNKNRNAK